MNALQLALAFLLICLGVVAVAAIPLLLSLSRRADEVANAINVSTQFQIHRYNSILGAIEQAQAANQPPSPKKPRGNLHPINGGSKDGPRKGDDNR